jgi:hypothetical protein
MKAFHLERSMTTLGGVFYPTGYMVLMFPTAEDARAAATKLEDSGVEEDAVSMATPELFKAELGGAEGDDEILPSAGSEGDTLRRFMELAKAGHHALIVHAPDAKDSERVMEILKDAPISYGQKYRRLVIEDLVT